MLDLLLLVADGNMKAGVGGLLERTGLLGVRPITSEIRVHPRRDPGAFREAHEFLRPLLRQASHAMVIFDLDGCGSQKPRAVIEAQVEERLAANGWAQLAAAVVIDPELEGWLWGDFRVVEQTLAWQGVPTLRDWMVGCGLLLANQAKPERPKEAFESALRRQRIPRSSSLYSSVAESKPFHGCIDPAFLKFRHTLQQWFPPEPREVAGARG